MAISLCTLVESVIRWENEKADPGNLMSIEFMGPTMVQNGKTSRESGFSMLLQSDHDFKL